MWFGGDHGDHAVQTDPRVKHRLDPLERYAGLRVALGLAILFVGLPSLSLPSDMGVIPYEFPTELLAASTWERYLLSLLGVLFTVLPVEPPWDLPVPVVIGTSWQIAVALTFVVLAVLGVWLIKSGWQAARANQRTLSRR